MNAVPFFMLSAVLGILAHWGGRRARALVVTGDVRLTQHQSRVVRRGARACWVLAGVFAVFAVATLVSSMGG